MAHDRPRGQPGDEFSCLDLDLSIDGLDGRIDLEREVLAGSVEQSADPKGVVSDVGAVSLDGQQAIEVADVELDAGPGRVQHVSVASSPAEPVTGTVSMLMAEYF